MTVYGVDVLASKAFDIGGTARIEPFVGWSILFIDARSGVIDATPELRRVRVAGWTGAERACAPPRRPGARRRPERQLHLPEAGRHHAAALLRRLQAEAVGAVPGGAGRVRARGHAAATARRRSAPPTAAARSRRTRCRPASTSRTAAPACRDGSAPRSPALGGGAADAARASRAGGGRNRGASGRGGRRAAPRRASRPG